MGDRQVVHPYKEIFSGGRVVEGSDLQGPEGHSVARNQGMLFLLHKAAHILAHWCNVPWRYGLCTSRGFDFSV
jgi:hypothetical protein